MPRHATGGLVYHVLHRGNGRQDLFHTDADAAAFPRVLAEARRHVPMRLAAAYNCLLYLEYSFEF